MKNNIISDKYLSIVTPVLNEEEGIMPFLKSLQVYRSSQVEIILVDGGSDDNTRALAEPWVDQLFQVPAGRAAQMNYGAKKAKGEVLLFLHGDTFLPDEAFEALDSFLNSAALWGHFDLKLSGKHPLFRIIERFINVRSRLSGIATGDQAMFIKRTVFIEMEGFPVIPLMEDVAFSSILKRQSAPLCINFPVMTDSRRWQQKGILKTVLLMWGLRFAFYLGVSPRRLHAWYYTGR